MEVMYLLGRLMDKYKKSKIDLYIVFIGLTKSYDTACKE